MEFLFWVSFICVFENWAPRIQGLTLCFHLTCFLIKLNGINAILLMVMNNWLTLLRLLVDKGSGWYCSWINWVGRWLEVSRQSCRDSAATIISARSWKKGVHDSYWKLSFSTWSLHTTLMQKGIGIWVFGATVHSLLIFILSSFSTN